jgi:hypothetical protein
MRRHGHGCGNRLRPTPSPTPAFCRRDWRVPWKKSAGLRRRRERGRRPLRPARRHCRSAKSCARRTPPFIYMRGELAESHSVLGRVQRRAGRTAEAAASFRSAGALVEQLPTLSVRNHYNLACYHALLAGVATEAGSGMTADEGLAAAERAMAALRQAIAAGYSTVAQLRTDVSLDTLRPREDFQQLVKELEEKASKTQEAHPSRGPN